MLILRNSLERYRASKSIANLPKCEHPWSLASQCFARFGITSSWRKQREGSGSGWKRVLSHYWGARLGRSARDRKKEKRNEKEGREEGDAAGENGSCCCLSPFEKSRETAETFFFAFASKTTARTKRHRLLKRSRFRVVRKRKYAPEHRSRRLLPRSCWLVP